MLDEVMMRGINEATGRTLPEKPTLMFEFVGSRAFPIRMFVLSLGHLDVDGVDYVRVCFPFRACWNDENT